MTKYISITKEGEPVEHKATVGDIFDEEDNSLQEIIDSVSNTVSANFTDGTTIATVAGIDIRVPTNVNAGNLIITGPVYFDTLNALRSSENSFQPGSVLITKGSYNVNDGGASEYIVYSSSDIDIQQVDNVTLIALVGGNYAKIQVPQDGIFNFRQFGARSMEESSSFDNSSILRLYMNFCDNNHTTYKVFIPGGIWQFSPIELLRTTYPQLGVSIVGENTNRSNSAGTTFIAAMNGTSQEFIWKIEGSKNFICNLSFCSNEYGVGTSINSGQSQASYFYSTTGTSPVSLYIKDVTDSYFDALYFNNALTAIDIDNVQNSYIGYLNVRQSGSISRPILCFGDNIQGVYIDYMNAESITGDVIYGYGTDTSKPVQFIFNDLQMEGTHPNHEENSSSITPPRFQHDNNHYFIFNGHIGDGDYPCIVHSISVSNMGSWKYTNSQYYQCQAVVGHESDVPMGIIFGNMFIHAKYEVKGSGYTYTSVTPWYVYDTSGTQNAHITINQALSSTDRYFYIVNGSCPLVNLYLKRPNIVTARDAEAISYSYKSGAFAPNGIVGTNSTSQGYVLYQFPSKPLKVRFYNQNQISSFSITVQIKQEDEWVNSTSYTISCENTQDWIEVSLPDFGYSYPVKVKISGLPTYIDYFTDT